MGVEIQDVIDGIRAVQAEIAAPTGEKAIAEYWDEPPTQITQYPCFVNIEQPAVQFQINGNHREFTRTVDMHLLFGPASQKYAVRARRKWELPVLDAFATRYHLKDPGVDAPLAGINWARIEEIHYEPVQLNESEYIAVTFALNVQWKDCFEAGVNGP